MRAVKFKISGRVQGVGFRYYTYQHAKRLGILGWVFNCSDRTVEVVAQAEGSLLQKFEKILLKGPSFSKVVSVLKEEIDMDFFESFIIKR